MVDATWSAQRWSLAACLMLMLCACPPEGSRGPAQAEAVTIPPDNTTRPRWIYQDNRKVAVVFVHGIFGDAMGTWTNANGQTFFKFLHDTPNLGENVDIYAFGFTSNMLESGSLKIGEAAVKLHEYLQFSGASNYEQIVFVAHSMGGLITMRELISHPEIARKVPLLVFYATPHEGSQITNIAEHVVRNPAIKQMFPVDGNDYLQQLNEDWVRVRSGVPTPTMVCAYETKPVGPSRIVPWASSTRNCDTVAAAIENSNHMTIVKPDAADHPSVVLLVNALRNHVLPRMDPAAWDTPDFQPEQDRWTYELKDINGKNGVVIGNRGAIGQPYLIELVDAADMVMSPEQMPRYVAPSARDEVKLILVNDLRPEYRLKVRLGSSPERMVIARIRNMGAAVAERNQRREAAAEGINAYLASSTNVAAFQQLSPAEQNQKMAELASEAIARQNPDLPENAKLLVTADTLASMNLANSAAATLGTLEEKFPASAKSASARRLAGTVSAQSGRVDVLSTVHVPQVAVEEAVYPVDLMRVNQEQRRSIEELADRLRAIPGTESEGLVLKGDIREAAGDRAGAMRAYSELEAAQATPIVRDRLMRAAGKDL